ncbi:MAG: hypothetical protein ACK5IQ_04425 [Bacteroidales bacterium]
MKVEPFEYDGSINPDYAIANKRSMFKSPYLTEEERLQIMQDSIHRAQRDFIRHPVTKGTIFMLSTVMTAGMVGPINIGSRLLSRNFLGKVFRIVVFDGTKLSPRIMGTKAFISASYQAITQDWEINLSAVLCDSVLMPFMGAALGNAFTLDFYIPKGELEFDTIFYKNKTSKDYMKAITKTMITGLLSKYIPQHAGVDEFVGDYVFAKGVANFVINTQINILSYGIGEAIKQ